MAVVARSALFGLVAGLFLALLVPQILQHYHLPVQPEATEAGPTSMAQVLRNLARRGAGGYKRLWTAPASTASPATSYLLQQSPFSTTTATMSSQKSFMDAVKDRRSYYQLNKEAPISDKHISEIAEKAILHVPSSFNSQSTRLVVLLNKDHETFWEFVAEVLKPMVPEDQFPQTKQKLDGFKGAYGTVSLEPAPLCDKQDPTH